MRSRWIDFDGQGPLAFLAPANGIPPQAYTPFIAPLLDTLHVMALTPWPMVTQTQPTRSCSWHWLAGDLAQHLYEHRLTHVIGIGHSLGAVLALLTAARHPVLIRALVLMDPVILPRPFLHGLRILRLFGQEHRLPLVKKARRRRREFASREEARTYFAQRTFFARWHPDAFEAYITHGLRELENGRVGLAYPPEWEAAIFASIPTDIWKWIGRVQCPVLVLYGERSNTFRPAARKCLRRAWPHAHFVALPRAGHMFPVEEPDRAAQVVREWLHTQALTHPATQPAPDNNEPVDGSTAPE